MTETGRIVVFLLVMLPFLVWLPWLDYRLINGCVYVDSSATGTVELSSATVTFHTLACGDDARRLSWPLPWLGLTILSVAILYTKMYYKSGVPLMSIALLTSLRRAQILVINVFDCSLFAIRPFQLDGFLALNTALSGDALTSWLPNLYLTVLVLALSLQLVATTVLFAGGQRNKFSVLSCTIASLVLNALFLLVRLIVWARGVEMEWFLLFKNGVLVAYDLLDILHLSGVIGERSLKAMEDSFDFMPGCYDFNNWVLDTTATEFIVIDPDLTAEDKMSMLAFAKAEHIRNVMPAYPLLNYDTEPAKRLVELDDTGDFEVWREADRWRTKVTSRKDAPGGFTRPKLPDLDYKRRGCELPFMNWSCADDARKQNAHYTEYADQESPHVGMPFADSQWRVVPTPQNGGSRHVHKVPFIQSALQSHATPDQCARYGWMACRSIFYGVYIILTLIFCVLLSSVFASSVYWLAFLLLALQILITIMVSALHFFGSFMEDEIRIVMFLVCLLPMCIYLPWINASLVDKCQYDASGSEPPAGICYVVDSEADKLTLLKSYSDDDSFVGASITWIAQTVGVAGLFKKALCFFLPLSYLLAFFNSGAMLMVSRMSGNHRQSTMLVADFFDICLYATVPWQLKGYLFFQLYAGIKYYYLVSLSFTFFMEILGASLVYGIRLFPGSCLASSYSRLHNVPQSLARSTLPTRHPDPRLISGLSLVLNSFILIFRIMRVFWFWHGVSVELLLLFKNIICILYDIAFILQPSSPQASEYMRMPLDMIADILPDVGSLSRETAMEVLKGGRLSLEDRKEGARVLSYNKRDWEELFFQEAIVQTQASIRSVNASMNHKELGIAGQEQAMPLTQVSNSLKDNLYYFTAGMGDIPAPLNEKLLRLVDTRSINEPKVFRRLFGQGYPTQYENINSVYMNPVGQMGQMAPGRLNKNPAEVSNGERGRGRGGRGGRGRGRG